jgi:uracil phosphoribosyltransferase
MGRRLEDICAREPRLLVNSFIGPGEGHGEVSRLVAKLRDWATAGTNSSITRKGPMRSSSPRPGLRLGGIERQEKPQDHPPPVSVPVQNFAVHRIPDVDDAVGKAVMCVLLRGASSPR